MVFLCDKSDRKRFQTAESLQFDVSARLTALEVPSATAYVPWLEDIAETVPASIQKQTHLVEVNRFSYPQQSNSELRISVDQHVFGKYHSESHSYVLDLKNCENE